MDNMKLDDAIFRNFRESVLQGYLQAKVCSTYSTREKIKINSLINLWLETYV